MTIVGQETMSSTKLCSYTYWTKRHWLADVYDGGGVEISDYEYPTCKYCGAATDYSLQQRTHVFACPVCGWWKLARIDRSGSSGSVVAEIFVAVGQVKVFDIGALDVPLQDLHRFLAKRPDYIANVHSTMFEKLMCDCLRATYQGAEVEHIGTTSDGGIDIKLVTTTNDTYLIQVKRRLNPGKKEGIRVVRELNGVLFREGQAKGMVITTAKAFTRGAVREAHIKTRTSTPYEIKLLSHRDVISMLRLSLPEPYAPWQNLLADPTLKFN
jgi:predicted RNA-binding Zn-ribbon protein involved in translation (DUF1610 family)